MQCCGCGLHPRGDRLADPERRVADAHLGVGDAAVRSQVAETSSASKAPLRKSISPGASCTGRQGSTT